MSHGRWLCLLMALCGCSHVNMLTQADGMFVLEYLDEGSPDAIDVRRADALNKARMWCGKDEALIDEDEQAHGVFDMSWRHLRVHCRAKSGGGAVHAQ